MTCPVSRCVRNSFMLGNCVHFRFWKPSLFWARRPEDFQGFNHYLFYFSPFPLKSPPTENQSLKTRRHPGPCGRMSYEFLPSPKVSSCTSPCKSAHFCASPAAPVQPHQFLCTHQLARSLLWVCANTRIIVDALEPSVCLFSHVLMLIGPGKM